MDVHIRAIHLSNSNTPDLNLDAICVQQEVNPDAATIRRERGACFHVAPAIVFCFQEPLQRGRFNLPQSSLSFCGSTPHGNATRAHRVTFHRERAQEGFRKLLSLFGSMKATKLNQALEPNCVGDIWVWDKIYWASTLLFKSSFFREINSFIHQSELSVKTFIMLQKVYFTNKCCSF